MTLRQHPLSAAFPAMPADELEALAEDIRKHGQREPAVLFDGMVLDGWHRFLACEKAGVTFKALEFDGADPVALVLSRNLHRRHLTASQRAEAVIAATNWRSRGETLKSAPGAGLTEKQMAQAAEVSERTIRQAKVAHEAGLGDAVKEGKVSAKTAAEVAKLPPAKREQAVKAIEKGEKPKPQPKPKVIAADPKLEAEYGSLKEKYEEAIERIDDLASTARELEDKLTAFEKTEPDEQQALIMELQKKIQRKDGEIARLTAERNRLNDKCNQLIRQVRSLQKGKR